MNKDLLYFLLCLMLIWGVTFTKVSAQVTIGLEEPPARGAILQIKTQSDDSENVTSTVGGVVLPRVKLVDTNTLEPFIENTDPDIVSLKKEHVGLTVYNMNVTAPFAQGLYLWDGVQWLKKGNSSATLTAGNGLNISENYVKLGGTLDESTSINQTDKSLDFSTGATGEWKINDTDFVVRGNGNVGIGTATPIVNADVNGNVNVDGKIGVNGNTILNGNTTIDGTFNYNYNASTDKYLVASDDNGTAEWVDMELGDALVVTGVAATGSNLSVPYNITPYYSANHYINLKPGRWLVKMTFLMRRGTSTGNSTKAWAKIGLSRRTNPNNANIHEAYDKYRDRINSSYPVLIEIVLDSKYDYTAVTGDIVIDTDVEGRFDLTVIKDQLRPNESFNWTSGALQIHGNATENVLLGLPLH